MNKEELVVKISENLKELVKLLTISHKEGYSVAVDFLTWNSFNNKMVPLTSFSTENLGGIEVNSSLIEKTKII